MADFDLEIRPFQSHDLPDVLELLRASLGETASLQRTPELFEWKHVSNPFGRSLMLVAVDGDTIAGFRAFMRWELEQRDGAQLRCVRAVDTATHPDYRRRGIFRQLTLAALDAASEDGVDMVFNTPNPRSGAGYLAMGWSQVGTIRPLASPTLAVFRHAPDTGELPDPSDFIKSPEEVGKHTFADRGARGLRTPRSAAYQEWRFTRHPTARYTRVEAHDSGAIARMAFRGNRRELLVSELYGSRPIRALWKTRNRARSSYVGAYFSNGSPERAALLRSGFLPVPGATMTLMVRPLRPLELDVTDLRQWDISLGDLELL